MNFRLIILFLTINTGLIAQKSIIKDTSFYSRLLHSQQRYSIYLPPGYGAARDSFPVLYLLHGMGGDHHSWVTDGRLQPIADSSISAGSMPRCIIVMPDAGQTYYLNSKDGSYSYEDYFVNELIPFIEAHYAAKTGKKYRSIAGLSMGGFGCLLYAMHHPNLFSACYAMSAGIRNDEDIEKLSLEEFSRRYKSALGTIQKEDKRITPFWNTNSILYLAQHMPEAEKKEVRYYIDCGDDDVLSKGNALLHIIMQEGHIPHEYRVKNGAHTWEYWQQALPAALHFLSTGF